MIVQVNLFLSLYDNFIVTIFKEEIVYAGFENDQPIAGMFR